jgi:hypothetical protein
MIRSRWRRVVQASAAVVMVALSFGCAVPPARTGIANSATPSASTTIHPRVEGTDTSSTGSDPGGLWAATLLTVDDEFEATQNAALLLQQQRTWTRAIESDFPPGGDITCDPRTFIPLREGYLINLAVTGPDQDLVDAALVRAESRMMRVTAEGKELTEAEYDDLLTSAQEVFTLPYISEPEKSGQLVGISNIDTEGERYRWMFRTFLRIVAEELRRGKALPARIGPFLDPETVAWLAEGNQNLPTDAELH